MFSFSNSEPDPELYIFQKPESDPVLKFSILAPIFLKFGDFFGLGADKNT